MEREKKPPQTETEQEKLFKSYTNATNTQSTPTNFTDLKTLFDKVQKQTDEANEKIMGNFYDGGYQVIPNDLLNNSQIMVSNGMYEALIRHIKNQEDNTNGPE